jgi:hypothetical protein
MKLIGIFNYAFKTNLKKRIDWTIHWFVVLSKGNVDMDPKKSEILDQM